MWHRPEERFNTPPEIFVSFETDFDLLIHLTALLKQNKTGAFYSSVLTKGD